MSPALARGGQRVKILCRSAFHAKIYATGWLYGRSVSIQARAAAVLLFSLWLALVLSGALNHVVWRDEVRALSLALSGDNLFSMFKAIHGEGHPAVWYLLLRGAHILVARPQVLELVSLTVACAATLLLTLRSPFSIPLIALLLFSRFSLYEYSVMARNYGISMLLLFLLAMLYDRHRGHGLVLGIVLLLLANCNAHSVLLVSAFLLFWLIDILTDCDGVRRAQALRALVPNAALAAVGVALCSVTIFPTFNDAASMHPPGGVTAKLLLNDIFFPAQQLWSLFPGGHAWANGEPSFWGEVHTVIPRCVQSAVLVGATFGLIRRPAALIAAVTALITFSLFFSLVYPGDYRHAALWFVFLISMYWIAGSNPDGVPAGRPLPVRLKPLVSPLSTTGVIAFLIVAALQAGGGLSELAGAAGLTPPLSRSRDLSTLIAKHRELRDAVIIADPDYLVEPLPYYIANRTYLIREQRFGNVVVFTRKARLQLDLDDIRTTAHTLHLNTGKPIIILLAERLEASLPAHVYNEGYDWELVTTPRQVRVFQSSTTRIARFRPAASDESFDVYTLDCLRCVDALQTTRASH